jgi:hypothetical protein
MRRLATAHSTHDELLLARLYGDDVNEEERARALDQMAECRDCADFFADLGAIAVAVKELPVPARPRDFTLTAADAARLGRGNPATSLLGWLGRTRALGGSLAAIGLAGLVLVGALSVFSPPAPSAQTDQLSAQRPASGNGAAYDNATAAPAPVASTAENGGTVNVSAPSAAATAAVPAASPATVGAPSPAATTKSGVDLGPVPSAAPTAAPPQANQTAESGHDGSLQGGGPVTGATPSQGKFQNLPVAPAAGPDDRAIALASFAGLLIVGLLLLLAPRLARRTRRTSR